MIELIDFSKVYSRKKDSFAVHNINLKANKGSVTGLIGPNGSGKTTILKAVCGFHYATSGTINLTDLQDNTFNIEKLPEKAMELIGYVPEIPALPLEMTVSEFLDYAASSHGMESQQIESAKERVIKDCTLAKFINKPIKTLSKGQKQRVSFAQALIHNPPNLILDEPMSGLDPAQIIQMRDLIAELSRTKAVLMSTHILQEIYSLCSNLYIMNEGKLAAQGTEAQIMGQCGTKTLEEAFIKLTTPADE